VLSWLAESGSRDLDATLLDVARVNMQCNLVKDTASLDRRLSNRLKGLLL